MRGEESDSDDGTLPDLDADAECDPEDGESEPDEEVGVMTMQAARQELAKEKKRFKNQVRFAAVMLARPHGSRVFDGMVRITRTLQAASAEETQAFKTQRGVVHLMAELANGSYFFATAFEGEP